MAIDYADSFELVREALGYPTLYTRPRDVSWQLDYAGSLTADEGKLAGMIDTEHTAVVGHSHGGYTALAAAGARLDFAWYSHFIAEPAICIAPPEQGGGNWCADILDHQQELADLAGLETVPEGLWPSWGDLRVDAIVGLAPAGGYFGPEGLQGVSIPALLMVGSMDRFVSPEPDVYQPYEYLNSAAKALIVLERADHLIFHNDCDAAPWWLHYDLFWGCSDPVWDMDRAHDLTNHFATAFLLATLKGDADAAAALAPDAVSFPGITYEAKGF